MTTMHIGTRDFSALYELLPVTEARPHVRIAGTPTGAPDSWEAWGTYIEDYPDGTTHPHHVIVVAGNTDLLLADLKRVYQSDPTLLMPIRTGAHRGTLVTLTMDNPSTWHHQMRRTESELLHRFERQERCQHDSTEEIGTEPDGSTIYLCAFCRDIWNGGAE